MKKRTVELLLLSLVIYALIAQFYNPKISSLFLWLYVGVNSLKNL